MSGNSAKSQHNTCMLDGIIRIVQLCPNHSHTFLLADLKHLLHPGRGDDLHVIIQEQKVLTS